ncbi:alpha/beta fold hydrolase [Mesorhizobium sp. LHD-90]|uniref:alpha/beta fold hydrolase n=1 Tax=Mesorhizobium sp. LHD-90 TaxID=3071414 RepID=UPI0027E1FE44|nr:alpha/beta fold hydrolase [Mesorhizobium sp. LHD-90]MDQ6432852.1 alpha/beta fold hydrolase [Mesorhizobium sp. LHD-90]
MALRQSIRFCTSRDGTRIAVASVGSGPPLLRAAHWLSHVEYDLESPVWRPWLSALSEHNTYVRYDQRGCGLSDRQPTDICFHAWLADLEAVAATIGQKSFPLLGMSQGGALAIAFALRHPERVSRLILFGAYARGAQCRAESEAERLEAKTLVDLIRVGWGRDNPAFRQVFTSLFIPGGTAEQHRWWNDLERIACRPEIAARTLEQLHDIDVSEMAGQLQVPTLVLHARGDARVPFEEGRRLAALIPNARFVPLDSDNHTLLPTEPAWRQFLAEVQAFVAPASEGGRPAAIDRAGLTAAEAEVLALVAAGLDNRAIAGRLGKAEKTVRNQLSAVLDKLGVNSRSEAIVLALKAEAGGS